MRIKDLIFPGLGKLNSDDDISLMPVNDSPCSLTNRGRVNIEYLDGKQGIISNAEGNTVQLASLPTGTNQIHGVCPDIANNAVIYFIQNSNDNDYIIRYNHDGTFDYIAYEEDLGFTSANRIIRAEIIKDLLVWTDNNEEIGCINISNAEGGVYSALDDGKIRLIRQTPQKPESTIYNDVNISTNNIRGDIYQFRYRCVDENDMKTPWSLCSDVIYDYEDESFGLNLSNDVTKSNTILLSFTIDYDNYETIEITYRIMDTGTGAPSRWMLVDTIDVIYPTTSYYFYNDKVYPVIQTDLPKDEFSLNEHAVPKKAYNFEVLQDNRLAFARVTYGYDLITKETLSITLEHVTKELTIDTLADYNDSPIANGGNDDTPFSFDIGEDSAHRIYIAKFSGLSNPQETIDGLEYEEYILSSDLYFANAEAIEQWFITEITNKTQFAITASSGGTGILNIANSTGEYVSVTYWYFNQKGSENWDSILSGSTYTGLSTNYIGQILYVCVDGGYIYKSNDYGESFSTSYAVSKSWIDIATGYSGVWATAIVNGEYLYMISGVNVGVYMTDSVRSWRAVSHSYYSNYRAAVVYGGQIYVSINFGSTWTAKDSSRNWIDVAVAGTTSIYMVAVVDGGQIYISSDYGENWTAKESNRNWIACDANKNTGQYMAAVVDGGQIYTSSDYGASWTARDSNRDWRDIKISYDGTKMTATVYGGVVYKSVDYGVTWVAGTSTKNWGKLAVDYINDRKYSIVDTAVFKLDAQGVQSSIKNISLKSGAYANFAIKYYDSKMRSMGIQQNDDTRIYIPFQTELGQTYDKYANAVKYTISHQAPTGAAYWQWMWGGSGIEDFFQVPVVVGTSYDYNFDNKDFEVIDNYIHLDLDASIRRVNDKNTYDEFYHRFDTSRGDRIRVIGYFTYNSGSHDLVTLFDEKIDIEIVDIDDSQRIVFQNWDVFSDATYLKGEEDEKVLLTEIYRPNKLADEGNLIYFEIGDLLQVSSRNHYASTVEGYSVTQQNQSYPDTSAIGVINFGNVYKNLIHWFYKGYYGSDEPIMTSYHSYAEFTHSSLFYNSRNNSRGRIDIYDEDFSEKTEDLVQWGGIYSDKNLRYNELNKFYPTDKKYLDFKYGNIYGIEEKGFVLEVIQRAKVTHIDIGRNVTSLSDGTYQYTATPEVLGTLRESPTMFGTVFPYSVVQTNEHIYFFDIYSADICRIYNNGVGSITDGKYKMRKYLRDKCNALLSSGISNIYVCAGWDVVNNLYVVTFIDSYDSSNNETMAFSIQRDQWCTFYDFTPTMYTNIGETIFLSFQGNGALYKHHGAGDRNTFEAVAYSSELSVISNKEPYGTKRYISITEDGNAVWECPDSDSIIINPDAVEFQDPVNYTKFYNKMQSELKESQFQPDEDNFVAGFLRDNTTTTGSATTVDLINGRALRGKVILCKLENDAVVPIYLKSITIESDLEILK